MQFKSTQVPFVSTLLSVPTAYKLPMIFVLHNPQCILCNEKDILLHTIDNWSEKHWLNIRHG